MRRQLFGLLIAGLAAAPLVAAAAPGAPTRHEQHWSYSSHGPLGVEILGITDELREHFGAPADRGILVAHVEKDSAAAKAGIQVGDVITGVATKPCRDAGDVLAALDTANKGDKVAISIVRDGKPLALAATMTGDPSARSAATPPDMERMLRDLERDMPSWWPHDHST